jgi:hypothetical protein
MKKILIYMILVFIAENSLAQQTAINNDGSFANALSILDINTSTRNKGVLLPRITTAQMNAITGTPAQGLLVYNTTENMFYYNNSSTATANWVPILSSAVGTGTGVGGWALTGNAGTNATINFLGTTDATDLLIKSGGNAPANQRMRILSSGNVAIGTLTNPAYLLTQDGTGNVFGVDNTATFLAKNSTGNYEAFFWPRWSDNIMYTNYGTGGFYIRNSASSQAIFMDNNNNVKINPTVVPVEKLDVEGNIIASEVSGTFPIAYWSTGGVRTETRNDAGLQGNAGAKSGFFETAAPSPVANWPVGATSYWHLLDIRHSNLTNNYSMQMSGSFYDQDLYFRKTNNNPATSWKKVLTWDRRTTIAAGTTTEVYADEYVKFRWNSASRLEISATAAAHNGAWAMYCEHEIHSSNNALQLPHSIATSLTATAGTWTQTTGSTIDANGGGMTFYMARMNVSTYPVYYIEVLRHGNMVSIVIQRVNP